MKTSSAKKLIWAATTVSALFWTLLVWGAHVLVIATGDLLVGSVGQLDLWPELERWLAPMAGWIEPLGQSVIAIVWALGLGVLGLILWAGLRLARIAERGGHAP